MPASLWTARQLHINHTKLRQFWMRLRDQNCDIPQSSNVFKVASHLQRVDRVAHLEQQIDSSGSSSVIPSMIPSRSHSITVVSTQCAALGSMLQGQNKARRGASSKSLCLVASRSAGASFRKSQVHKDVCNYVCVCMCVCVCVCVCVCLSFSNLAPTVLQAGSSLILHIAYGPLMKPVKNGENQSITLTPRGQSS